MIRAALFAASVAILLAGALIAVGEEELVDPVCGMAVSPETAAASTTFDGKVYYFCSTVCYDRFMADPRAYVAQAGDDMEPEPAAMSRQDMETMSYVGSGESMQSKAQEYDSSTLEGSMEKLEVLMLLAVEGVLEGDYDEVKIISSEITETSMSLKGFSDKFGVRAPGFDAFAIELGESASALEASLGDSTQAVFNSLSMTLSNCVSCHMNFRDLRSRPKEHHHH
jgi:YHS domain-containing protein